MKQVSASWRQSGRRYFYRKSMHLHSRLRSRRLRRGHPGSPTGGPTDQLKPPADLLHSGKRSTRKLFLHFVSCVACCSNRDLMFPFPIWSNLLHASHRRERRAQPARVPSSARCPTHAALLTHLPAPHRRRACQLFRPITALSRLCRSDGPGATPLSLTNRRCRSDRS